MKTRRFVGSTHHEAMRQVRQALGPDALIVSSRRSDAGVEIIVADESTTDSSPDVMSAIDGLRGMLEHRIDAMTWDAHLKRAPASAVLFQTLMAAGFSTALARSLLAQLPADQDPARAQVWVRNALLTQLPVLAHEEDLWGQGGVFALVGPTGVGKTTTIAKLAARCALRVGANRVVMLTTDSYRIGAYEQLQIYGRLMQVPVHSARDADELRQTLDKLGEQDLILVDNVGLSQRDRQVAEQAAMLCAAGRRVRRLLVLNAASHGDTLDEVVRAYLGRGGGAGKGVGDGGGGDEQPLQGCILTKLDEAARLGAALDTAIRYRLPVHYVSHGQRVPEDLALADAAALLDCALAQTQASPALYAPNEADIGALCSAARSDVPRCAGVQGPQRRQLLKAALAAGGQRNTPDLEQALDWLQDDPVMTLTRRIVTQTMEADAAWTCLLDAVREAFAPRCQTHLLALHGTASLKPGAAAKAGAAWAVGGAGASRLASTVLLSDHGAAIAAPYQQWLSAQTCLATWSEPEQGQAGPLTIRAALRARIARVSNDHPQLPLIHLLEGGSASLWQALSQAGVACLSKIGAASRVVLDDGATTAQALARNLAHTPVPQVLLGSRTLTVWAGEAPVRASVRGPATLRLITARVIDSASGAVAARLYGLSNLAATQVPSTRLAAWLVQQHSAKSVFRFMAPAWLALAHQAEVTDVRKQALLAGQLGLASWHLTQTASAQALRRVLENLAGSKSATALPGALLRLFALLDMAES